MKNIQAIPVFIGLLITVVLFHLCIIAKVIPYNIAWGGRLQNDSEMYVFEAISIAVNLFLILVLLMKGNYLKFRFRQKIVDAILWIFFALFLLNTLGNLFAATILEKSFSIITLLFAILIWLIIRNKKE